MDLTKGKNLLTLPLHRGTIVAAKLAVSRVWYLSMAVVHGEALVRGFAIGRPGFTPELLAANVIVVGRTVLVVYLASSVSAQAGQPGAGAPQTASIVLMARFFLLGAYATCLTMGRADNPQ